MKLRLALLVLGILGWMSAAPRRHILLLNSYGAGYDWTDQLTRGIANWADTTQAGELWVEYMDARRYEGRDLNKDTEVRLREKFGGRRFDLILTTDDEAFEFMRERGRQIYPGVPVVAGGIGPELAAKAPRNQMTGVVEVFNVTGALDLAFRLHPKARRLYAVTDPTPLGVQFRQHVEDARARFADRAIHIIDLSKHTLAEAAEQARQAGENSILMICYLSQDRGQPLINRTEAIGRLISAARGPVYALSYNTAGNGLLAASATNGGVHAEMMSAQADRILRGESTAQLPFVRDEHYNLLFDYQEMKRWSVSEQDLPDWVSVVNRPLSFLAEYARYIYGTAAFLVLLIGIIAALVVAIRRRHAAEAELKQALAVANETAELKTRFLANVSHELRTPLNGILGMSHLLHTTPLNAEQAESNSLVNHSAHSLVSIVDDLLDLAQIESGQLRLKPDAFHLREELDRLLALLQFKATDQNLTLTHCIEAEVPESVPGDCGRLRQVLTNLISNGLKFTTQGGVRITIGVAVPSSEILRLRFEVADSGVGIAEGDLERIFDPFTQADNSPTRRVGGAGLGLTISRHLVRMMGGELQVASVRGGGSRFWFELPFTPVEGAAPAQASAPPLQEQRFEGRRVLVVEDNDINRRVAQRLLEKAGCEVCTAIGGAEGVRLLSESPFDLVLMDIQMPGLSGLEATQQIRNSERNGARTPIVAMTASAMKQDRDQCAAAGMDGVLEKPVDLAALDEVLRRWLRQDAPVVS